MEVGIYFLQNQNRVALLSEDDWRVALAKCKEHIRWRLKQKTLSGVHAASNLGADPVDHYLGIAYEKILSGEWEWKEEHSLAKQMIQIVTSYISKAVEKGSTTGGKIAKVIYKNLGDEFYDQEDPSAQPLDTSIQETKLQAIYTAAAGDDQLEFLVEALKEGKKRGEIAELLEIEPRQLDKLKEKLIRRATKAITT